MGRAQSERKDVTDLWRQATQRTGGPSVQSCAGAALCSAAPGTVVPRVVSRLLPEPLPGLPLPSSTSPAEPGAALP
ncbi:hypothetical protein ACRRTK_016927 [Alexandromys fortis]